MQEDTREGELFPETLKREYLPEKMQNEYDKYSTGVQSSRKRERTVNEITNWLSLEEEIKVDRELDQTFSAIWSGYTGT